jgi:DNA end-binding protein Ku
MARNVILSFGLVSIEVSINKATDSALQDVKLVQANPDTGNKVKQQYIDPETGEVVDEPVKGVFVGDEFREVPKDKLDEITEAIKQDGSVLDLQFVPRDTVPEFQATGLNYLKARKGYEDKLVMLAEAMRADNMAFVATMVPTSRENLVVGFVEGKRLYLATMPFAAQVREVEPVIGDERQTSAKMLTLAKKLIKASSAKSYEAATADIKDTVVEMRREAIDAVVEGKPAPKPKARKSDPKVESVEDLLAASLEAVGS